jgi:hypothetical protein
VGRTFFGPFKASAIVNLTFGKDDEVFLSLRDRKDNVLGIILDRHILSELAARSVSDIDGGTPYVQTSAKQHEPVATFAPSGLHRALLRLFRLVSQPWSMSRDSSTVRRS